MFCFDCTNRASFDNIKQWVQNAEQFANPEAMKVLVGCKSDRIDSRVVSADESYAFAKVADMTYLECSSKTGTGVEEIYNVIVKELVERCRCGHVVVPAATRWCWCLSSYFYFPTIVYYYAFISIYAHVNTKIISENVLLVAAYTSRDVFTIQVH